MPAYEVHLYSNTGTYLRTFTKRITRLDWSRHLGEVGRFTLTLSDRLKPIDPDLLGLNSRLLIYRKATPFDMPRLEMMGFTRKWKYKTDNRGVTRYHFTGTDQNDLIYSRVCINYHPYVGGFAESVKTRYVDTLMRELVEDNLGAGSSNATARDIVTSNTAGLTVAIESSATTTSCTTAGQITYEHGAKNLLLALQELNRASKGFMQPAVGTAAVRVFFDMCADTDTLLTFRTRPTRWGLNHRADSGNPVYIGLPYGNLREPAWEYDRTQEVNCGMGTYGMQAAFMEDTSRSGEAPLNRREAAESASGDMESYFTGWKLVHAGKSKPRFSGMIQDTPGCRFGVHWQVGDELSIDYLERQYNVMVLGVDVECEAGRERIRPDMEVQD